MTDQLAGIWSAVLTPVDESFDPDPSVAVPYYRDLLEARLRRVESSGHDRRSDVV